MQPRTLIALAIALLPGTVLAQSFCPDIPNGGYMTFANSSMVLRLSDQANIPIGQGTTDSVCYQLWLNAGNTPTGQVAEPPQPPSPQPTPEPEPDPSVPQELIETTFLSRLTGTERNSLNSAIGVNPSLSVTVNQLGALSDLTSPEANELFNRLVDAGAVSPDRREALLQ